MRSTTPEVFFIGETKLRRGELMRYLKSIKAEKFTSDAPTDAELLTEVAGRLCYNSFVVGLNPNVTKVREGNELYIGNILKSRHGSVMEHAKVVFIFKDVARVFTHELVRHRVGVGISQESLRYVPLSEIPFRVPPCFTEDPDLSRRTRFMEDQRLLLEHMEQFQKTWRQEYGLDDEGVKFDRKKEVTSGLRRWGPMGVSTAILWSCNFRNLRHIVELRTAEAAEEEIRIVFQQVAMIMKQEYPNHFQDFEPNEKGEWVTKNSKV
jgi:thymidylate synthase (FAD)